MTFREWLANNGACSKALEWLDAQPDKSPENVWATCPRGEWVAWEANANGIWRRK